MQRPLKLVGLLGRDGMLLEANEFSLSLVGVSKSHVMERPFWDTPWWSHSRTMQELLYASVQRAASGSYVHFQATHPTPSGELRIIDFALTPIVDHHGEVISLLPVGCDITEDALRSGERDELLSTGLHNHVKSEARPPLCMTMCAWCQCLRDVRGGWHPMDPVVAHYPKLRLSHGICPSCVASNFPGMTFAS
ncbi:MAG: PAS domain-containing protein [Polyangiales bacterium]|nr:PAS domain-containing protein [Myxococcales bacterium]